MKNKIFEKVDGTIESICDYIQEEVKMDVPEGNISDMVKALAELISARAKIEIF